jgi:Tfp pilus assembly protein PilF
MEGYERHLEAALGYLHLGMPMDAHEELDAIPPERKAEPLVLRARAFIYHQTHDWEALRDVSAFLVSILPEDSQHWIWLGYAARRCQSINDAEVILLDALARHPREPMLHFNLACYAAQTERVALARERLAEAIRLDPTITKLAVDDPDLQPLW